MSTVIRGKVWKFGDSISTDYMSPGFARGLPWEEYKKKVMHIHPRFTEEAKPGDVIVAGRNFGCGSSRESAPANLKKLGLGCVVAESYGRIYFRNSVALAFPSIVCQNISKNFDEGDELELELETGRIKNLTKRKALQGQPLSRDMLDIITKGGIIAALQEKLGIAKS
jgi:3-isopropylmalate/(R)-2-methylmalate dehydratase small subunit